MRRAALVSALLVLVLAPAAHAERATIATFAVGGGVVDPVDPAEIPPHRDQGAMQLRATISFEEPAPPYVEPRGYAFRATLVPEIFVGSLMAGADRATLVGGGARFELAYSQSRMGLLQVSMRGGLYVAARGGLFADDDRTPFIEGAIGEYFLIGSSTRIGLEGGLMSIRTSSASDTPLPVEGAISGPPFDQGYGSYVAVNACVYLGVAL